MRHLLQASVLALAIPSAPALASPATGATPSAACVAGDSPNAWKVAATDPSDAANSALPLQMESAHFALHWKPGTVDAEVARAASAHLEYVWNYFLGTLRFPEPHCGSAEKFKVNAYVGVGYGLTGGTDQLGHMGMWIDPGALKDRFGLAHELTHALQAATGRLMDSPYTGWLFESHANWMTVQLPEFRQNTHCSVLLKQYPHLYYGSTRTRYCNWQFLEYLKDTQGFEAVNAIWRTAPGKDDPARLTADPFSVLQRNMGWTQDQLNDTFGDWALHNANWDYTNPDGSDQGAVFRRNYGTYEQTTDANILSATVLDPVDLKRRQFAVPEMWAPQRWGYNVVKLHADAGRSEVTVTFRGVVQQAAAVSSLPGLADEPETIPSPASDWRWGVVAVGADGSSRYTPLQRGAKGSATITVRADDTGLYLVVMATPSQMQKIRWDQPYYSIYRYPWMVQFDGALPDRWQPGAPDPIPGGHRHANGGGWAASRCRADCLGRPLRPRDLRHRFGQGPDRGSRRGDGPGASARRSSRFRPLRAARRHRAQGQGPRRHCHARYRRVRERHRPFGNGAKHRRRGATRRLGLARGILRLRRSRHGQGCRPRRGPRRAGAGSHRQSTLQVDPVDPKASGDGVNLPRIT
nr:Svx/AvrXca family virulence/avirulence protein [Novosphingobium panipatense]